MLPLSLFACRASIITLFITLDYGYAADAFARRFYCRAAAVFAAISAACCHTFHFAAFAYARAYWLRCRHAVASSALILPLSPLFADIAIATLAFLFRCR